jgi:hypothetical protein
MNERAPERQAEAARAAIEEVEGATPDEADHDAGTSPEGPRHEDTSPGRGGD